MPLPKEQLEFLHREAQIHEERIDFLRSQAEYIAREIRIHELVIGLSRDEGILQALADLADDPSAARDALDDPGEYADQRGINIPDDLNVSVEVDGDHVAVRATYDDDFFPFVLIWDRDRGFRAESLEPRGQSVS